jgi:3-oxoadipate enol-lactonase
MPHVNVRGTDLYYESQGSGKPLVLLRNGLGCTKSFTEQMPDFSKHHRVVAYDRHGYGRSSHLTALKRGWLEESVGELMRLLDEINIDRADLCGICAGGAVALLCAAQNPSRVNRLVVAGTCCFGEEDALPRALKLYPHPDDLSNEWLRELSEHHGVPYGKDLYGIFYQAIKEENGYPFKEYDLRPTLHHVRNPVLVIYGDRDNVFQLEQALTMYRNLQKAELCVIPDCGHLPNEEKPVDFNREALAFFQRHEG